MLRSSITHTLLAVLLTALPFSLASCGDSGKDTVKTTMDYSKHHADLVGAMQSHSRMVFASMAVTKTAVADDSRLWGKRIGVYSYDTYVRAWIDLSQLQPGDLKFDDDAKTVDVSLPPISVEIAGRDLTLHEDYTNIGLLRPRFSSADRARAKELANRDFRKEFNSDSSFRRILTDKATSKATAYFQDFFSRNGYTATVHFK